MAPILQLTVPRTGSSQKYELQHREDCSQHDPPVKERQAVKRGAQSLLHRSMAISHDAPIKVPGRMGVLMQRLGAKRRFRCSAAYMLGSRGVVTSFHPMNKATVINKAPVSRYGEFIRQTNSAPPTSGPLAWPRLLAAF